MIGIYAYKLVGFLKVQWARFRPMPVFLKIITFFSLMSVLFLVLFVIPIEGMSYTVIDIDYTYSELWLSGAGPFVSALGIAFPICGVGFLRKKNYAKFLFVGLFACLFSVSSYISITRNDEWTTIVSTFIFIAILIWYLFFNKRVAAYYSALKS